MDNLYWGGDLNIPLPRPSFQINDTNPGTDAAASASAAFSACSSLYANRAFNGSFSSSTASLHNASYAQTLLTHSQQLYTFAANSSGGLKTYQSSVPEIGDAYPSTDFGDDLAMAALWLSWANGSAALFQDAEDYYKEYKLAGTSRIFNWDSKTPGLAVLFAQIAQSPSGPGRNLAQWKQEAEKYFDGIVNNDGPGYLSRGQ